MKFQLMGKTLIQTSSSSSSGREKKHVRVNIQETRKYLECGSQVEPLPSPLQGI